MNNLFECLIAHFGVKGGKLETGVRQTSSVALGLVGGTDWGEVGDPAGRAMGRRGRTEALQWLRLILWDHFGFQSLSPGQQRFHAWALG